MRKRTLILQWSVMIPRWITSLDAMPSPQLYPNLNNARMSTKPKTAILKHRKVGKNVTMDLSHCLIKKTRLQ
jgi:hypothetical protein